MQISCFLSLHNIRFEVPMAQTFPFAVMFVGTLEYAEMHTGIHKTLYILQEDDRFSPVAFTVDFGNSPGSNTEEKTKKLER